MFDIRVSATAPAPPIDERWALSIGAVYGEWCEPVCCFDWMSWTGWYVPVTREEYESNPRKFTMGVQRYEDAPLPMGTALDPWLSPQHIDGDGV